MSARAYTMKEMRVIVDYLVEHKAYSEIRGRKMWMAFASSGVTTRSWQSLKETFLKRILPDIHNPYYKLSPETIRSFREGKDVANKIRNKLEFRDSKDEAEAVKPSTCTNNGENGTGEDIICSNLHSSNRASTETIILKTTDEEMPQDDIDNHDEGNQTDNNKKKSLRDCITFTEPLTPMMQEILHDFESDDEEVASIEKNTKEETRKQDLNSEKSNLKDLIEQLTDSSNDFQKKTKATENITSSKSDKSLKKSEVDFVEVSNKNKNPVADNMTSKNVPQNSEENKINKENSKTHTSVESKRNLRNRKSSLLDESHVTITDSHKSEVLISVPDSLLPNNQEGLISTLNFTETSKPCSNSHEKAQEKATTSPKDQEESKTSKLQKIIKKKFETTPNKKKDSTGQAKDPEHEIEKSISKADDITKVASVNCITLVDKENHTNDIQSVERTESDIPNNLDEPEISRKRASENRVDQVNQAEVVAKKGDGGEILSTQSQPPSNPCLQSVSLYEENLPGYSSNSSDLLIAETPGKNIVVNKEQEDDEILFLASDSVGDLEPANSPPPPKTNIVKQKRKRLLNNLFSKKKDVVNPKRRRYHSLRANLPPAKQKRSDSSSSWTSSDSDCTFVSPPPSPSKRRRTKTYLKPVSSKLFSLGRNGTLFAASHNKIYPVINDRKGSKEFLDYIPEEDSAEEEAEYWKLKYVEECKKTGELKKLFEELKSSSSKMQLTFPSKSPILPSGSKKINLTIENNLDNNDDDEVPEVIVAKQVEKPEPKEEDKTVKIKYAKNDEAISLEGQWMNVKVILQDVMQLINKDRSGDDVIVIDKPAPAEAPASPVSISGTSTPDEDPRLRVNDLEESISQDRNRIEELNKQKEINDQKLAENSKRRGRPKKREAPSTPVQRVEPKTRRSKQKLEVANGEKNDPDIIVNEAKLKPVDDEVASGPAQKTPRTNKRNAARVQASKQNISKEVVIDEDSEIRYKFPSPKRTTLANDTINIDEEYNSSKKFSPKLKLHVPLSSESTQGYQDSDEGPLFKVSKKKKSLSTIDHRNKNRRNNRRQSYEYSNTDASNECSISLPSAPRKTSKTENSTLNTEAYRSESYQMLMPMTKQNVAAIMDQIQEGSPCPNEMDSVADTHSLNLSPASQIMDSKRDKSSSSMSIQLNTEPASSSSVSLPMSPELSIVENISLNKSNLNIGEQPTINESQANEDSLSLTCDKFALSNVDVTMPLMEQECHLRKTGITDRSWEISYESRSAKTCDEKTVEDLDLDINSNKRGTTVSESLLSKLDTVNIEDNPSFVTSLDGHMKNLLLESAKKAKPTRKFTKDKEKVCCDEKMEVDIDNVNANEPKIKTKQKKRCSTPRKRQNIVKSQPLFVDGVIEEETVESCVSGRQSCPAVFSTIADSLNNNTIISKSPDHVTVRKPKKTKQIIKVKILRPKPKKSINKAKKVDSGRMSTVSARTDSGINDTTCSNLNEAVELIHNHSETCLQASECFDNNSVKILSPSGSIISLTTSSLECEEGLDRISVVSQENSGLPPEMYCSKARDGTVAIQANTEVKLLSQGSANADYHTPPASVSSLNSLITEDLSSEITSKHKSDWYLLSDEDATNTVSNLEPAPNTVETSLYNTYLRRLFPVTVAVPDLSTITEGSKDTDSQSRQNPTRDTIETINLLCSEHLSDDDILRCQS